MNKPRSPGRWRCGLAAAAWLCGVALAAAPARAESAPPPLTLEGAVRRALENNALVQAAHSGREAAEARVREARAGWLPSLQASETFTRSDNPVFVFGSLLEQARFGPQNLALDALNDPSPLNNFRTVLSLNYPLFEQLRTETGVASALTGEKQAAAQLELVEQRIRFEVVKAFFGVLVSEARVEVAREALRTGEADRDRVRDLYDTGVAVRSDLLSTEVQLAEFHQQRIQAVGERAIAYAALNTVLGNPVDASPRLAGQLVERTFPEVQTGKPASRALQTRPDYLQAALEVERARAGERAAWGRYLPRVDVFASYAGSAESPGIDSTDYSFGAGLTLPLLEPGRTPRLERSRAGVREAEARRRHLASQVGFEVVAAQENYLSAGQRLDVANRAVVQAKEALRIVQDRYDEGLTTITEVLRSETALVRARLNVLAARYEVYVGYARVLLAGGRLEDVAAFAESESPGTPPREGGEK